MMESTEKLNNVNEVLSYLAAKFPSCFILEGEAKPLKVGLFQELAERLEGDEKVSKTQLRQAMRRYSSSWRYLKSFKEGAERIDLDGGSCGLVEAEHIEHAQKTLKESQERVKQQRQEQNKTAKPRSSEKPSNSAKPKAPAKRNVNTKSITAAKKKPAPVVKVDNIEQLSVNQKVKVKLGKAAVPGQILDIAKGEVNVQLDSGLTVKVRVEHIVL